MTIKVYDSKELIEIVAELVQKGIGFEVESEDSYYLITLTGAF